MSKPPNIEALSTAELKALVGDLLCQVSALGRIVSEQRDEIARSERAEGSAGYQAERATERYGEGEPSPHRCRPSPRVAAAVPRRSAG